MHQANIFTTDDHNMLLLNTLEINGMHIRTEVSQMISQAIHGDVSSCSHTGGYGYISLVLHT
jgi:hypothetical protein